MSDPLDDLIKIYEQFKDVPPPPVGLVFREGLRGAIQQTFPTCKVETGNMMGIPLGIPIYFDPDQEEDCLQFTDKEALQKYLNRREDPQAGARGTRHRA